MYGKRATSSSWHWLSPIKNIIEIKKEKKKKETQNELRTEDFINFYKFC